MRRDLGNLAILSFLVVVALLGLFKIVDFDFGWHLKAGEYIYTTQSIPKQDIFSFIVKGNQWVDSHWLFQLFLYISYALGGPVGSTIFQMLILFLTFTLLLKTIYRPEYYAISIIGGLFALFMSFQRFLLRPEIFTLLFLVTFFYFIENFDKHPRLSLLIIPLCQVLWANMHGLHILGVVLVGLYLLGDLGQGLIERYILSRRQETKIKLSNWKPKGFLFILTFLATLLNANALPGILYPYKIFSELRVKPTIFANLAELVSPFAIKDVPFPDPSLVYKIFLILSVIIFICRLKHLKLSHLFLYLAFMYLSIKAIRNVSLFAMVAVPITVRNTYGILDFFLKKKDSSWVTSQIMALCLLALSIVIGSSIVTNKLYQRLHLFRTFGFGLSDEYPTEAVNYLKNKDIKGNIFNSSDIGGYLIWQMYPKKQVALDPRWEVYGDFLDNIKRLNSPLYFAQLVGEYDIEAIILYKRSWEFQLMSPWLDISPFWQIDKDTFKAVVYSKIN